ncbi:MAG: hypothetical protein WAM69_13540, partial [Candidatus Sulfotelmatobacter sp.]
MNLFAETRLPDVPRQDCRSHDSNPNATTSRMLKNDSQSTGRRVSSGSMRGDDQRQDGMFSYISPDKRVP